MARQSTIRFEAGDRTLRSILAVGGLTLALAIAVATSACGAGGGERPTPRDAVSSMATPATAGPADIAGDSTVSAPAPGVTYYFLVASQEQAAAEAIRVAAVNRLREANGERDLVAVVIVVGSDEEAAQIQRAVAEVNAVRQVEGLAGIEVIDRRSS